MKLVHSGAPVVKAAQLTGYSRRAMYKPPQEGAVHRSRADEEDLRRAIRRVALANPLFGHRRVWNLLRSEGRAVNRKRVHRLMKAEELLKPAHFPRPRKPLTGRLGAGFPNQKWSTDLTEILTTDRGVCHLMTVLDACTREVIAWDFLPSYGATEALDTVERAVLARFPKAGRADGLILKTDGGPQFVARRFVEGMKLLGIEQEVNRPYSPEDNGLQESFHGKLKMEYPWVRETETYLETRGTLEKAIPHYNECRPHSSLGYQTPRAFYAQKMMEAGA